GTWSSTLTIPPNAVLATDWPNGSGDVEYDWNSPKLMNYSSVNWGTGSTAWTDNCEAVMRQANIWLTTTGGKDGTPDLYLLSSDMFVGAKNFFSARNRILTPHKEAEDLGFTGSLNF